MTAEAKAQHIQRIEEKIADAKAWLASAHRAGIGNDQRRYADLVAQHERELAEAQRIEVE